MKHRVRSLEELHLAPVHHHAHERQRNLRACVKCSQEITHCAPPRESHLHVATTHHLDQIKDGVHLHCHHGVGLGRLNHVGSVIGMIPGPPSACAQSGTKVGMTLG